MKSCPRRGMYRCKRASTSVSSLVRLRPFLAGASRQWSAPCFAPRVSGSGIPLGVLRRGLAVFRSAGLLAMKRASRSRRGHRCLLQTWDSRSQEESTKVFACFTSCHRTHLSARLSSFRLAQIQPRTARVSAHRQTDRRFLAPWLDSSEDIQ